MSYQVTKFVLDLKGLGTSEKAVLHSFAYHADKDGGNSYPAMETVAREAGLKHRQSAQRVVRRLERKGFLVAETQKTGGRKLTTKYRVNLGYSISPDALSSEKTASVETAKQHPSGSENQETASVGLRNSIPPVAGKVLKVLREEKSKREKKAQLALSKSEKQDGQEKPQNERRELAKGYFVWLFGEYLDLSLSGPQKREIRDFILSSGYDLETLRLASRRILDPLEISNPYSHAGSKVAASLPAKTEAVWQEIQQRRKNEADIARQRGELERRAAIEREALQVTEANEEAELADSLAFLEELAEKTATV